MKAMSKIRGRGLLTWGLALVLAPISLSAQGVENRERAEEYRAQIEQRIREIQAERLAHLEELRAMVEAELAQVGNREHQAARMEHLEQALAEAKLRMEETALDQVEMERLFSRQMEAQERVQARLAQVREREQEARVRHLVRAEEARERARAGLEAAQQVMVQLRTRVRLGVTLDSGQGEEANARGAEVQSVMDDSPAQEAGLMEGDIITHLNGQSLLAPIPGEAEAEFEETQSLPVQRLLALARDLEAGDEVEVRYLRDGAGATVTFEAAEMDAPNIRVIRRGEGLPGIVQFDPERRGVWSFTLPEGEGSWFQFRDQEMLQKELEALEGLKDLQVDVPNFHFEAFPEGAPRGLVFRGGEGTPTFFGTLGAMAGYGLSLTKMNPGLSEYFGTEEGLLVLDVEDDSTLGLVPGDVIQAIDGRGVEDAADLRRILRSYEDDETVTFTVIRKGEELRVEGTIRQED